MSKIEEAERALRAVLDGMGPVLGRGLNAMLDELLSAVTESLASAGQERDWAAGCLKAALDSQERLAGELIRVREELASAEQRAREAREEGHMQGCRRWAALFGVRDDESVREYRERADAAAFERGVAAERAAVCDDARGRAAALRTEGHDFNAKVLENEAERVEKGWHHPEHSDALDRIKREAREEGNLQGHDDSRRVFVVLLDGVAEGLDIGDPAMAAAVARVREQVRAETLAACFEVLQRNAESEAYAGGDGEPYLIAKSALRMADVPGADALARREQAAAVRALRSLLQESPHAVLPSGVRCVSAHFIREAICRIEAEDALA